MWRCNEEIRQRVAQLERTSKKEAKHYIGIVFFVNIHILNGMHALCNQYVLLHTYV